MAFGFSSKYIHDFPVTGVTTKRSYVIAVESVKELGWELRGLSESGFVAHTSTSSIRNWSEEVQVKLDFHNINIKSESVGYQFTDWGKNKRNAERFIETYNSIKDNYSTTELDTRYHELEKLFISPFAKEDLFD